MLLIHSSTSCTVVGGAKVNHNKCVSIENWWLGGITDKWIVCMVLSAPIGIGELMRPT